MPVQLILSRSLRGLGVNRGSVKEIAARVRRVAGPLASHGRPATVTLLLCADPEISIVNRRWLERDRPTNVIAFPSPALQALALAHGPVTPGPGALDALALAPGHGPALHLGDITVSVETAAREAGGGPADRDERTVYLALHGLLHLLGWTHEDDRSWRRMHRTTLRLAGEEAVD